MERKRRKKEREREREKTKSGRKRQKNGRVTNNLVSDKVIVNIDKLVIASETETAFNK